MLFNSVHFLWFFPIVTVLYFILPHRVRWLWLLICSYYFYMSWNPKYALLMFVSTVITYLSGILIDRANRLENPVKRVFQRKLWASLSFTSNLAILFFFKYFDFAVENLNKILSAMGVQILQPTFDVLLPVGISFYTFQALSYTMDVYRGDIYVERNLAKYALFVSFFPQLVAGPIERSKNLLVQINERHVFDYNRVKSGLLLMLWGFFEKLVVADRAAILVNNVFGDYQNYSGEQIAMAVVLFAFQIYCDFSGYSDIATGAAQVMGFRLMVNFRQPYFATSIQDFWRRWHISLSTWFRDYLYISLGGNRGSRLMKYRNIMITFLISGLWHGANWNYVLWGGLHGGYQIIGDIFTPYKRKLYGMLSIHTELFLFKLGRILVTFTLVCFAWIFFRAPGVGAALGIVKRLIVSFDFRALLDGSLLSIAATNSGLPMILMFITILLVVNYIQARTVIREVLLRQNAVLRWSFYYIALFILLIFGEFGANQFIYFQF